MSSRYGDGVLVVLTNYSRPQNMPAVIRAWREQSVPAKQIVVVDNSPRDENQRDENALWQEKYPCDELRSNYPLTDVWRIAENLGCPCWFSPALMLYGHRYVLHADDDFLPGKRAVENLLNCAERLDDQFATVGQIGRRFNKILGRREETYYTYNKGNKDRGPELVKADLVCRSALVRADTVECVIRFRQRLLDQFGAEAEGLVGVHDDFLSSLGIQLLTGMPSYVIPASSDPNRELIKDEIKNGPESVYKRPNHYAERQRFVELAVRAGWRSLC